jgi:hypothetical protein
MCSRQVIRLTKDQCGRSNHAPHTVCRVSVHLRNVLSESAFILEDQQHDASIAKITYRVDSAAIPYHQGAQCEMWVEDTLH